MYKLFRVGGDEFIMIVIGKDVEECQTIITNIRKALDANPFTYEGNKISMKTAAGIAEFDDNSHKSDMLKQADDALYADKKIQPKSSCTLIGGASAGKDVLKFPIIKITL